MSASDVCDQRRPFLPQPIASDMMALLSTPLTSLEAIGQRQRQIAHYREQVGAAIDTIEIAIQQNHANYLARRASWSYPDRIEANATLKTLKRQRQHLQEMFGAVNRQERIGESQARFRESQARKQAQAVTTSLAEAFMEIAQRLLVEDVYTRILDLASERLVQEKQM